MAKNTIIGITILLVLFVTLSGCGDSHDKKAISLENKTWVLISFQENNEAVTIVPYEMASTLHFNNATGIVAGFVMCNQFTSGYSVAEDNIIINTVAPTEMACGSDDEGQEHFVINVLGNLEKYSIKNEQLILISTDDNILNFIISDE